jgi:hypothetical protein
VAGVIVTATKQQAGWARLRLKALRELGKFLLRTPYLKGRPPKVSTADTLPSLEKLGIKDRRIAWRAIAVAKISEDIFNEYLATTDEPTERGLLRYALGDRDTENYSESENVVSLASAPNRHSRGHPWWFPSARGKKYLALHATTASEEWYTPERVFTALGCKFDLDVASPGKSVVHWLPASRHFTIADNGLEQDWGDAFVWMNPPYGPTLPQWLEKFREHGNGIALVVDRTSTGWWQTLCSNADLILQVNKKIDFMRPSDEPGTNALGSTLAAYGQKAVQALTNAAAAGLGTVFKPCQSVPTSGEPERETRRGENYSESERCWLTPPPDLYKQLNAESVKSCPLTPNLLTDKVVRMQSDREKQIIALAVAQYEGGGTHHDGDINVDHDAVVSENDDPNENGCYVAAWVWVRFDGTPFDKTATASKPALGLEEPVNPAPGVSPR